MCVGNSKLFVNVYYDRGGMCVCGCECVGEGECVGVGEGVCVRVCG